MSVVTTLHFIFLLAAASGDSNYNLTVKYYEDVITQGTEEAFVYPLPQNAYEYKPLYDTIKDFDVFDYIVVGAGSSGAVLATRLSENKNLKVLLLEAGGPESSFSDTPGVMIYLQGLRFNWNYITVPQNTCCLGMVNKQCPYPRGKILGGTSVINALMYVRGNRKDFDSWAWAGNTGWSFNDVLPYFIKSENSQVGGDEGYHGVGGFLNVEYYHGPYSPEYFAFIQANLNLGRKVVDYNGKTQLGVATVQQNNLNGRRDSTAKAFLLKAINRKNLVVMTYSYVTKVLINSQKEAYGVLFSHEGQLFKAIATKEVILSAGAIGSPQILMLSGIGPAAHLKQLKIPVVQDLPVGNNFQDHSSFYGLIFSSNYSEPVRSLKQNVEDYLQNSGPLTRAGNNQAFGFYRSRINDLPSGVPDVELIFIPANSTNNFIQKAFHYTDETYDSIFAKLDPLTTFRIYLVLLHPKSRGTIRLKSANPYDYPLIDPRFLSDPNNKDIDTMYEGIQIALQIIQNKAFKKLNASLVDLHLPACSGQKYLSKPYWYCLIRQLTMHMYHPIGTCKMGPSSKEAVVDKNLKVYGIKNLRVADASIIPQATSGHTNAVCIMIGEKLSDLLKGQRASACYRQKHH